MSVSPLAAYRAEIERELKTGHTTESSHRPALKTLLEALGKDVTATNEPKRVDCGAPDFAVSRSATHGPLTIGYVETKDVGTPLGDVEKDSERASPSTENGKQLKRYRAGLSNLVLTDYLEFRWYVDGQRRAVACLGALDSAGRVKLEKDGPASVEALLADFVAHKAQPIRRPKELAERMARLTHLIRDTVVEAFARGNASAMLKGLRNAFAEVLIPDLTVDQFADMFSQTLAYGLFAARVNHTPARGRFQRIGAAVEIPKTNPFLRKLFGHITGPELDDEPFAGFVDDLTQLLADTDMAAVLAEFGKRTRQEDPIVHFYETFLAAYDPKLREMRGVYYTPEPVVSYIVRSVDYLLRQRFGCRDGLADATKTSYIRVSEDGQPHAAESPRVLILDPACGTGTFLYAVIDLIRNDFMKRGDAGKWSAYVRECLLPRLFGFELLMAPYAVAHLKLGMQLAAQDLPDEQRKDWAYDFAGDERLGIYLTNSLEEALKRSDLLLGRYISEEANAAAEIKRDLPIMVVLGNPPYSNFGRMNKGRWISKLIEDYKTGLQERKHNLNDDYVKFIRFAQWRVERTGAGVVALVTNHSFLDGITHRVMRQKLMDSFNEIYVLNLHGGSRRKEKSPAGKADENVFDIQQGVAISIFLRASGFEAQRKIVRHADLWGSRSAKYALLAASDVSSISWVELDPKEPYFFFKPWEGLTAEYEACWKLVDAFPEHRNGLETMNDALTVHLDREPLRASITVLSTSSKSELREKFGISDSAGWSVDAAVADVKAAQHPDDHFVKLTYRPFDQRWTWYSGRQGFIARPRREIMVHLLAGPNIALLTTRQTKDEVGAFVTRQIAGHKSFSAYDRTTLLPLYLYQGSESWLDNQPELGGLSPWPGGTAGRRPNLNLEFVADVERRLGLVFVPDGRGDLNATFGPEDVFHYIYAVLHSPTYRTRYAEFLKVDFPRIPLTDNVELFRELATHGAELVALHLMESPTLANRMTKYPVVGENVVEPGYPRYIAPGQPDPQTGAPLAAGRVYINRDDPKTKRRGQYFEGVPPEVWEFHVGGYQVCDRWLKDRRGRKLTFDDIQHYEKIVVALHETIHLMTEIDEVIEAHGGWPIQRDSSASS